MIHRQDLVRQRTRIAAQVRWYLHELDSISFSPEIGTHGFWPSVEYVFPEAAENLRAILLIYWCTGGKTR